jgi:hypothetical protein
VAVPYIGARFLKVKQEDYFHQQIALKFMDEMRYVGAWLRVVLEIGHFRE